MAITTSSASESAARRADVAALQAALDAAIVAEAASRVAGDASEATIRGAQQVSQDARLDNVEAVASVSGGAQTSTLTNVAGTWAIDDIGSDGTTLSIYTTGPHQVSDGDYLLVEGTTSYNGLIGPVDVIADDEIRVATTIPNTAHDATGVIRTAALRIQDSAGFYARQWVEVVNDAGEIHVSPIASVATGIVHLDTPIPTSWTDVASEDAPVTVTTKEVVLARVALAGSTNLYKTLPDVLRILEGGVVNVSLFNPDKTGVTSTNVAIAAAVAVATARKGYIHFDPGTYRIESNITLPSLAAVEFAPGAVLKPVGGATLTVNGPIIAGHWQIFDASVGNVLSGKRNGPTHPEWFGADPDGLVSSTAAFLRAADFLQFGGTIEASGSGATYLLSSDAVITRSNLIIDGLNATIVGTSAGRFWVNGDHHINGDWSTAVYNTHIKNWRVGTDPNDAAQIARGPRLSWCIECSIENVHKTTAGGTGFAIDMSRRSKLISSSNRGARASGGAFGALVHMSDDTLVQDFHVGDGPFYYGVQTKGGYRNVVKDSTVFNVHPVGSARTVIAFRDRGNAPFKAAGSSTNTLTYPYADIGWTAPDTRRASHGTRYENCRVINSEMTGFLAQEAFDTEIINSQSDTTGTGLVLKRTAGSTDARLTIAAIAGANVLTVAMEIDDETGLPEDPWLNGQNVTIELDTGVTFSTTASGDQVGSTLTIASGLPSAASVGNGLGRSQTGTESGYLVRNFRANLTTGYGISILGVAASYLADVTLTDVIVTKNSWAGINANYTDKLKIIRAKANNNSQSGLGYNGINIQNSTEPTIVDSDESDDQVVHTQQFGLLINEASVTLPTVRGNRAYGNVVRQIQSWEPGFYSENNPGEGQGQTTTNTSLSTVWRMLLTEGQRVEVELLVLARRTDVGGTDSARYYIKGTFAMIAGVITQIAAPAATPADFETTATYAASFQIVAPYVRLNVLGATGHTVNWTVRARTLLAT